MRDLEISVVDGGIRIEGFRDDQRLIDFDSRGKKRLADLVLHKGDLSFSLSSLNSIGANNELSSDVVEALWRSAIIHFIKCFGVGDRFLLQAKQVYKKEPPEALVNFEHFKSLRNKHIVHDENSYVQAIVGAVLNPMGSTVSVECVACVEVRGATLNQSSYSNLRLLIEKALGWVAAELDSVECMLREELNGLDRAELDSKGGVSFKSPVMHDVNKRR